MMENGTNDNSEWVDRRMALLDSAESLEPNAVRAFARLRERDRRFRIVRRNWIWGTALASVACIVMLALPTRALCCTKPDEAIPASSYKQAGSAPAPITVEIYADFECPACAAFYRDTYPLLVSQYVKTGKVRILHRDFPLPQHAYAKLAARYANAAGELGQYDLVFSRLFETQPDWGANGNIEASLAPVLAPDVMAKIRSLVAKDPKLDDSVAADMSMGMGEDHLTQTPTLIVVVNGVRHKLAGAPSFTVLSAYLNELRP